MRKKIKEDGKIRIQSRKGFELDMFENAMDFISNSLDPILIEPVNTHHLKYSILHLHAGVELLFKKILEEEHWSLIFQNTDKANSDHLQTGDFISVNSLSAKERLRNVCNLNIDEPSLRSLEQLRKRRNTTEHYGVLIKDTVALKSIISDVLLFVLTLIEERFDEQTIMGRAKVDLEKIRQKSLAFKEFVHAKLNKLQSQVDELTKTCEVLTCPKCLQKTFAINGDFQCLFCKYTDTPERVVSDYITNVLKISKHSRDSEFDYFPLEECPECERTTLLIRDDDLICFGCHIKLNSKDYDNCDRCNRLFKYTEDSGVLCSSCWNNVISD